MSKILTEEHKKKISASCKGKPKKKIYYRFYVDDNGLFQIDLVADVYPPKGYKPLTVKTIESSSYFTYKYSTYITNSL